MATTPLIEYIKSRSYGRSHRARVEVDQQCFVPDTKAMGSTSDRSQHAGTEAHAGQ
jgi:hypothetical protein